MILLLVSLFFVVAIPVAILIYAGIKLIFRFKANDKMVGRAAVGLWIISIILFAGIAISEGRNFRTQKRVYSSEELTGFKAKTLYITIDEKKDSSFHMNHFYVFNDEYKIYFDKEHQQIYGMPHISIQKSDDSTVSVVVRKKSFGSSPDRARDMAKGLEYKWILKDTMLVFDPYFVSPQMKKWLFPNMEIIIKIPVGKQVYLATSLEDYMSDTPNYENLSERDMVSKKWIMKRNGLSLVEDK